MSLHGFPDVTQLLCYSEQSHVSRHGNFAALLQYHTACKFKQQDTKSLFQIVKHTEQDFQPCSRDLRHPLPTDY